MTNPPEANLIPVEAADDSIPNQEVLIPIRVERNNRPEARPMRPEYARNIDTRDDKRLEFLQSEIERCQAELTQAQNPREQRRIQQNINKTDRQSQKNAKWNRWFC